MMIIARDGDSAIFTENDIVLEIDRDSIFLFAYKIGHSDVPEIVATSQCLRDLRLMFKEIKDAYGNGRSVCDLSELWGGDQQCK